MLLAICRSDWGKGSVSVFILALSKMHSDVVDDDSAAPTFVDLPNQVMVFEECLDLNRPGVTVEEVPRNGDAVCQAVFNAGKRDMELSWAFLPLLNDEVGELSGEKLLNDLSWFVVGCLCFLVHPLLLDRGSPTKDETADHTRYSYLGQCLTQYVTFIPGVTVMLCLVVTTCDPNYRIGRGQSGAEI
jgi:hypothetical protein